MQTQVVKKGMIETAQKVINLRGRRPLELSHLFVSTDNRLYSPPAGLGGFYDGFAAAAARQMICTSMRFSFYEFGKHLELMRDNLASKVVLASIAGVCSSIIGIPLDVINIRMQNDMKSDEESKRKYCHWVIMFIPVLFLWLVRRYKNLINALKRIPREEGWSALYNGGHAAVVKAAVGTIGQIAVYDQVL